MQLIHVKIFNQDKEFDVWIENSCIIEDFINDITKLWFKDTYMYEHFLYHTIEKRILNNNKSFKENHVIQSDRLILF